MSSRWLYREIHGVLPARRPRRSRSGYKGPARSWRYKAWIRSLPCAACGTKREIEAAHTGSDGGQSQKASDYSCIPLCRDCHQFATGSYHRDRQACELRIVERTGLTTVDLVKDLNGTWRLGRTAAA
jgi:hypothetical protein